MAVVEYVTADGHLIDPVDGVRVRTNWDSASVGAVIDHFMPVFEKIKPLAVFIGFSRRDVDTMDMIIFWNRENLEKSNGVYRARREWDDLRDERNQMIDAHNFPLARTGFIHRGQPVEWSLALTSYSKTTPARYRQIWPPQAIAAP